MTQDKMRRIITACVSAATVLVVFLLGFLIYQWITIAILNDKIEKVEQDIATEQTKMEQGLNDADYFKSEYYLDKELQRLELINSKK